MKKSEFIKLKKNEFLQIQDSNSSYEGFILKGAFKTYILNDNGTESVIFFSFENEWMCDLESFYHQKPTTYNIKAIEDSEILVINKTNKAILFEASTQANPVSYYYGRKSQHCHSAKTYRCVKQNFQTTISGVY